jgi:pimeloyl-ACP methyl ester carboxylesterase
VTLPRPMSYMHDEALTMLPRVLDATGVQRAVLIGHSDGGSIAAIHAGAVRDPRVLGVVLIAAHFFVEELNIASIAAIKASYEEGDLRSRLARYHRDVEVAFHGWNDAWLDPRFRAFDITEHAARIRVPVLALQGAEDPYGTAEQLRVLERVAHCPVETHLITGARHAPHLEAPEATLAAVVPFVRSVLMEAAA